MRPSTIFFDLDETLVDHSHATCMSARSFRHRHTVIVSESATIAKPDPGIFLAACESAGKPPHQCAHIGDSFQTDVQGAISAGLTGIWLNRNGARCLPETPSDLLEIKTLDKLRAMLDKRILQGASNEKFRHL